MVNRKRLEYNIRGTNSLSWQLDNQYACMRRQQTVARDCRLCSSFLVNLVSRLLIMKKRKKDGNIEHPSATYTSPGNDRPWSSLYVQLVPIRGSNKWGWNGDQCRAQR